MRRSTLALGLAVMTFVSGSCGSEDDTSTAETAPRAAQTDATPPLRKTVEKAAKEVLGDIFYTDAASTTCTADACRVTYEGAPHNTAMHPEEDWAVGINYDVFDAVFSASPAPKKLTVIARYQGDLGKLTQTCTSNDVGGLTRDQTFRQATKICRLRKGGSIFE